MSLTKEQISDIIGGAIYNSFFTATKEGVEHRMAGFCDQTWMGTELKHLQKDITDVIFYLENPTVPEKS